MKKYRIGLIGNGAFGLFCLQQYKQMEEIDVVAIAAKDMEKAREIAKEFNVPEVVSDYRELLSRSDIDAVAIFTPPYLHGEMALAAAQAGKAFLCEKPLATDLEAGEKIAQEVKRNKVPATLGYVMRYTEFYQEVAKITKEERFGKLKRMVFENYASREGLSSNHWLWDEGKSGGLLVEHGVHFFDIFESVVGAPFLKAGSFIPSPDTAFATVRYPDNILATFYHLFDKTTIMEKNEARFVFDRGYAVLKGWIPMEMNLEWQDENGKVNTQDKKITVHKDTYYAELVKEVMKDLLSQIDNPNHKPKVTIEDGLESLRIAITAKNNPIF